MINYFGVERSEFQGRGLQSLENLPQPSLDTRHTPHDEVARGFPQRACASRFATRRLDSQQGYKIDLPAAILQRSSMVDILKKKVKEALPVSAKV